MACDIDFLLVEHYFGVPVAVIEYKALGASRPLVGPNYLALRSLADASNIPFAVAEYDPETWGVRVYPMNTISQSRFNWGDELTEREWVTWLHQIRGQAIELRIWPGLHDVPPRPGRLGQSA